MDYLEWPRLPIEDEIETAPAGLAVMDAAMKNTLDTILAHLSVDLKLNPSPVQVGDLRPSPRALRHLFHYLNLGSVLDLRVLNLSAEGGTLILSLIFDRCHVIFEVNAQGLKGRKICFGEKGKLKVLDLNEKLITEMGLQQFRLFLKEVQRVLSDRHLPQRTPVPFAFHSENESHVSTWAVVPGGVLFSWLALAAAFQVGYWQQTGFLDYLLDQIPSYTELASSLDDDESSRSTY